MGSSKPCSRDLRLGARVEVSCLGPDEGSRVYYHYLGFGGKILEILRLRSFGNPQ